MQDENGNQARRDQKFCLVIDDSSVMRRITRRILEGANLRVAEAEDGRDGLAMCRDGMPDAIFVDSQMPNVDGFDFVHELRQMQGGKVPKVFLCATENDPAQAARAHRLGVDQFILKPFEKAYLIAKFQDVGIL